MLSSILIIYTGGTIGMIENPETGVLESFNFQHLKDNMPELKKLGYAAEGVWPVDMFPGTNHVESVIMMRNCGFRKK